MAKAITARLAEIPGGSHPGDQKYIWLLFPIVVTTGDLLVVDSSETSPAPEQRDWVGFSRELKSGKLSGNYALDFVRQDRLEKFVRECIDPLGALAKELVESKTDFLLKVECPWQE